MSERKEKQISTVAFVIPMFNEAANLPELAAMFAQQHKPRGVQVEVILSDNGSTDGKTPQIAQELTIPGVKVTYVDGSANKSIGSARRVGTEKFVQSQENTHDETPDNRLIVSFDADTRLVNDTFISSAAALFEQSDLMAAYGPSGLYTSTGKIVKGPSFVQQAITRSILRGKFRQFNRRVEQYITPPYDMFPGFCTLYRQSAYEQSSGYHDENRTGEDLRLSLELQHRFSATQIVFDKRLSTVTSARGRETKRGNISLIQSIKDYRAELRTSDYIPGSLRNIDAQDGNRALPVSEVEQFIRSVDKETYDLNPNQEILAIKRLSKKNAAKRDDILPAVHGATKQPLHGYYAIIN